jgi:hypothetical protein
MVFQNPPTFSVGRLVVAADANTYLRDNITALAAAAGVMPVGILVHWAMDIGLIPAGWAFCDGSNGTPDLRDRFVIGAGGAYALDQRGGQAIVTPGAHSPHNVVQPLTHGSHGGAPPAAHPTGGQFNTSSGSGFPTYGIPALAHTAPSSDIHTPHSGAGLDTLVHQHSPVSLLPPYQALGSIQRLANAYTYTTPRTWVDGEVPTAAILNTELRDNPGYLGSRILVQGSIIPWSGSLATIPSGWALCNGQNGTPDLRDRFVIGAGGLYTIGSTGGSTALIIPAHSAHVPAQPANHSGHAATVPAHIPGVQAASGGIGPALATPSHGDMAADQHSVHTGFNVSNHSAHAPVAMLPPYYSLAFIQLVGGSLFTAPKTWVDGEIVEAAELNTYWRDNQLAINAGQFPVGGIAMYRGAIPAGFALCDGTAGTPNLVNRFIAGATLTYNLGDTGGSLSATIAAHEDHSVTNPAAHPLHTISQPPAHGVVSPYSAPVPFNTFQLNSVIDTSHSGATLTGEHSHTGTAADSHSAHATIDTTPPYHALYYIQRIS